MATVPVVHRPSRRRAHDRPPAGRWWAGCGGAPGEQAGHLGLDVGRRHAQAEQGGHDPAGVVALAPHPPLAHRSGVVRRGVYRRGAGRRRGRVGPGWPKAAPGPAPGLGQARGDAQPVELGQGALWPRSWMARCAQPVPLSSAGRPGGDLPCASTTPAELRSTAGPAHTSSSRSPASCPKRVCRRPAAGTGGNVGVRASQVPTR
jgi:hypothetical protein